MSQHTHQSAPDAAGDEGRRRTRFSGNRTSDDARPGELDGLLGTGPVFTHAVRGYDRLQVDDYVAWAETELHVLRRENDHLLSRYAAASAELQNARRRLAQLVRERQSLPSPEDAAAMIQRAEADAERIREDARTEAEARLAKVAEMRQAVTALREQARAEAAALVGAARGEAEELRRRTAAEQARATAQITARAEEQRAAVEAELAALRAQRDQARESLHRLGHQIGDALQLVAGALPDDAALPGRTDLPDEVPVLAERREAAREEADGRTGGDAAPAEGATDVTALHGTGRGTVAAAS
ncbi:F0F1-type ATP synthase membrane subunit b/b' [Geodermatophilus tzadiensis]|uniref:F0F1-type ATP synthase membrane subunit b/b n=1 Tax=Geodermatophilus tzadiensis TaxID=1137988 RepID=A0A2T0TVP9_9ACTN|nr:DivIVA domain-containing protein [Geodermatophilus tzadiensis]PRY49782.1 F0F1-type ATP synthase membrane subunit b/b' [Geodermatophilus tzadiensis]